MLIKYLSNELSVHFHYATVTYFNTPCVAINSCYTKAKVKSGLPYLPTVQNFLKLLLKHRPESINKTYKLCPIVVAVLTVLKDPLRSGWRSKRRRKWMLFCWVPKGITCFWEFKQQGDSYTNTYTQLCPEAHEEGGSLSWLRCLLWSYKELGSPFQKCWSWAWYLNLHHVSTTHRNYLGTLAVQMTAGGNRKQLKRNPAPGMVPLHGVAFFRP